MEKMFGNQVGSQGDRREDGRESWGIRHEREFLGVVGVSNQKYKDVLLSALGRRSTEDLIPHFSYEQALQIVRETYKRMGIDPNEPDFEKQPFLRDLKFEVEDLLNEKFGSDHGLLLQVYTTISDTAEKTSADYHHGVDFFIDVLDKYGIKQTITGDLSMVYTDEEDQVRYSERGEQIREDALEKAKAQILVGRIPHMNTDKYLGFVEKIAHEVVEQINI